MFFEFNVMANRRYNLNNSSRPSGSANSTGGPPPLSPAPAAGASPSGGGVSSGKNSVNIPAWIMPIGIAYLIIRGLFIIGRNYITIFDWVIIAILAFFAILSFWNGKNRWLSLVLIVAIGCIIWFNQAHIYSFKQQSASPTEQSAGQELVTSPSPPPEVWDSTQFSDRGGILLDKPHQEVNVPENSELCVSELTNPLTKGNLQQKIFVGEEFFSSRMSQCWDIAKGNHTIRIGDTDSAEIKQYKDYNGRVPVIRPK